MQMLILGLVLFLVVHSIHFVAADWRERMRAQFGHNAWRTIYSIVSVVDLIIIIVGYAQTRINPYFLWQPPELNRHIAAFLILFAFVGFAAAIIPGNRIKRMVRQPLVLGVAIWAFAHLLINGRLGDVVLFGVFLLWASVDFMIMKHQNSSLTSSTNSPVDAKTSLARDVATVITGIAAWVIFAFWLHGRLIGVQPLA